MRILLSDEIIARTDRIYNSQNDRIGVVSRSKADRRGRTLVKRRFPQMIQVLLRRHISLMNLSILAW